MCIRDRGETELSYLESVLGELARAESERDILEIRQELAEGGYIRDTQGKKRMKLPASRPMRFRSTEGFVIWVGRNNRQNDQLTLKQAAKGDLWLHTQKIHGSHVIVETNGQQPSDETVTEAMMLADVYKRQLHEGVDKNTVADLAGHGDTSFLERTYCHPQMQLKQEAAKRMSNSCLLYTSLVNTLNPIQS